MIGRLDVLHRPEPVPVTIIGPPSWWNPFSTEWFPSKLGQRMFEFGRDKADAAAQAVTEEADRVAKQIDALKPDPLRAATVILGEPSWGYYGPAAARGLLVLGLVGGTGYLMFRASKKKRRGR